jgi:GDP-4-dehydro-6-deoxy-D-mannose reductase
VGESWEDPTAVLEVNVLGTAAVLAAARRLDPAPPVLVVSSSEVYGAPGPDQLPLREEAPLAPVTPYAASKAAAEQVALQAWRGFGQSVAVVRPFNHIGPGQACTFVVSALARRVIQARRAGAATLAVGDLSARRDFTDVRDVVRAYRLLMARGEPGTLCNVCSGTDRSVAEIAARLLALAGVDLELVPDPTLLRPVEVPVVRGDPGRLQAETGWKPEIGLEATLRDVLDYWAGQPAG